MNKIELETSASKLISACNKVHASCRVVFSSELLTINSAHISVSGVHSLLFELLSKINSELQLLVALNETVPPEKKILSGESDSIDVLGYLSRESKFPAMAEHLENLIWQQLLGLLDTKSDDATFFAAHASRVCSLFHQLVQDYLELIQSFEPPDELSRISPRIQGYVTLSCPHQFGTIENPASYEELIEQSRKHDQFYQADAFRYIGGTFNEVTLESVKTVDQFYGFTSIRERFRSYFDDFAQGEKNLPLLISSLPGLGKTQYTIAFVKAHENLTLILPEPEVLEAGLEGLISQLAQRPAHRFVVFFDDVDTAEVNWFNFRTHVGGCFSLPKNVTIVVASNYEFPANISSRGIGITYPMFDEIRCLEMIMDYLAAIGMKRPPNDLISIIGADYVEEFGMRNFEDLSPRTLARYLELYDKSPAKRKRMLEMSRQKLITKPDPQSFYDENLRLLKTLYGEEGLKRMREHVLGTSETN